MSDAGNLFMVFDVEAIGLHGEGFAAGYVVVRRDGHMRAQGCWACPPDQAAGTDADREWVAKNVPPMGPPHFASPKEVRGLFWNTWRKWADQGAVLVADCAWPVEARFLAQCVDDEPETRRWTGPYPLHDLASILLTLGHDPVATCLRHPSELPEHHPLNDARQTARRLVDALKPRYIVAQQHPKRSEVSIFLSSNAREAREYQGIGWTVLGIDGTPALDNRPFGREAPAP